MNGKTIGIVAIVAILLIVASGIVLSMLNDDKETNLGAGIDILILGSDDSAKEAFDIMSSSGADVTLSDNSQAPSDFDAVIITESWFESNTDALNSIVSMVNEGLPVSVYKYDFEWENTGLKISYSDEAMINSVCNIGDDVKCFGVTCDEPQDALDHTLVWIANIIKIKSEM